MSREHEAARWVACMHGPTAAHERTSFEIWMRDPANATAFALAEEDMAFCGEASRSRIAALAKPAPRRTLPSRWAIATIAAVAIATAFAGYIYQRSSETVMADGQIASDDVYLEDGTKVTLLKNARITAAFSATERRVKMAGGWARFTVAHDASRPFRVVAGESETTALGTIFEVDLRKREPSIHLVKGSVEVRGIGQSKGALRLFPGEAAAIRNRQATRVLPTPSPQADAATMSSGPVAGEQLSTMTVADGLPLGVVITQANRVNAKPVRLKDPRLASLEVSGRFDVSDALALARKLASALHLSVTETDDAIWLSPPEKKSGG